MESGHPDVTPELIAVPLVADGRTLGVMSFVAGTDRTFREDDLGFAQDLGHHAALVLARRASMRPAP
jgi:GAF domain-containing protein